MEIPSNVTASVVYEHHDCGQMDFGKAVCDAIEAGVILPAAPHWIIEYVFRCEVCGGIHEVTTHNGGSGQSRMRGNKDGRSRSWRKASHKRFFG